MNLPYGNRMYQQSIYKGPQLIATFMQPSSYILVAASAEASVLHFVHDNWSSIRTVLRDGTLVAEHHVDPISLSRWTWKSKLNRDGSFLASAASGERLYVCSADGSLQAIGLGRPAVPANQICIRASNCDALAAVCIIGQQAEVLFVDLAQQRVMHRHDLPSTAIGHANWGEDLDLALSRCSLAFCHSESHETRVLASDGTGAGFVLPDAFSPSWDQLGTFLAVMTPAGVRVYTASGKPLASLSRLSAEACAELHWQPDSSELMWTSKEVQEDPMSSDDAEYMTSKFLLRFR